MKNRKKEKIRAFDIFNLFLMLCMGAITLIPCLTVVAKALSDPKFVLSGAVGIWPRGFQLDTILYVLKKAEFLNAFRVSVFVTVVGTAFAMLLTILAAYPLSKPDLRGRKAFLYIFVFVMLFNAGMVPKYLLYRSLKLTNTVWALVFSGAFSVSNMFIVKNFFESLPESVEEAAKMDGASNMQVLYRVVLPMSTPVLATVTLFYGVSYWSTYFAGVLYITDPKLKSLQHYLYDMITMALSADGMGAVELEALSAISSENLRSATIVLSTIPILVLYPYLQKYFVKGISIGSVKG